VSFGEFARKEFPSFAFLKPGRDEYEAFATKHATTILSSCDVDQYMSEDRVIYVHDDLTKSARLFTCSNWPEIGQPRFMVKGGSLTIPSSYDALLRNHFVWHPEVFHLAARVVHSLGLFNYISMHARYNDFQFKEDREAPKVIMARWMDHFDRWLGKSDTIYISTDGSEPEKFVEAVNKRMKRPIKVVLAADIFNDPKSPIASLLADMSSKRLNQLKGPIEQVICTFAKVFVGTAKSTFSGYIERMRANAEAPQHVIESSAEATRLVHTEAPSPTLIANVDKQLHATGRTAEMLIDIRQTTPPPTGIRKIGKLFKSFFSAKNVPNIPGTDIPMPSPEEEDDDDDDHDA